MSGSIQVSEGMRRAVFDLCDAFDRVDRRGTGRTTDTVRRSLDETIRLAVVGRVKAGKSTLVNALVGRVVAPTAAVECTRITTHYTFGGPERGEVVTRNGQRVPFDLVNGCLPEHLPVPIEHVAHAVVYLQSEVLRDMTLIDTPGLATTTTANEEATRRTVLGHEGVRAADALLCVFRDMPMRDDMDFLREWASVTNTPAEAAAHAIGVLTHADTYGGSPWSGEDPIEAARGGAARFAQQHGAHLGNVIAVAGNMAQAARAGLVREHDATMLGQLTDVDELDLELRDPNFLGELAPGILNLEVSRLAELIGEYGIRFGRDVSRQGARALSDWLGRASGIDDLRRALAVRYVGRYVHVKARRAMEVLQRLAWSEGAPMPLRGLVAEAKLRPELHPLEELDALERLAAIEPNHPLVAMLDCQLSARNDAERLAMSPASTPEQLRTQALTWSMEARRAAVVEPYPERQNAYNVLDRSFTLLAMRLGRPRG
ncbi:dynamin family protein [Gulosibacter sp. 10]|uniref:dynamin family protein n=1 Tax=Gulosibacter sp. 10 TaxID=1255570 RepID=UPI00097E7DB0|nr:dynamin family protein [Gulosibacter sp. 10]SJM70549.1 ISONIAZID INDUCTIBLE GENE PROTEIN INIC [Gulosibacter sp. 10]